MLLKRNGNPTPALSAAAVGTLPLAVAEIHVIKLYSNFLVTRSGEENKRIT